MKILIFGANGPTGRLATRRALQEGHTVTAFTRHPESFPLTHQQLRTDEGDVLDTSSVSRAMQGQDAVLSALGVPYSRQPITVYSEGVQNIIAAMGRHEVRRFVCISSSAVDPDAGEHGGFFFERILQPFVAGVLGKTLYDDMKRMEAIVTTSDIDWTVLRPSGLFDAQAVSDYQIAERYLPPKFTARIDLADALVRQARDGRFLRKLAAVATVTGVPTVAQLMRKEAFKRKPRNSPPREGDRAISSPERTAR